MVRNIWWSLFLIPSFGNKLPSDFDSKSTSWSPGGRIKKCAIPICTLGRKQPWPVNPICQVLFQIANSLSLQQHTFIILEVTVHYIKYLSLIIWTISMMTWANVYFWAKTVARSHAKIISVYHLRFIFRIRICFIKIKPIRFLERIHFWMPQNRIKMSVRQWMGQRMIAIRELRSPAWTDGFMPSAWDGLRQLGIDQEMNIFENNETGGQSKN